MTKSGQARTSNKVLISYLRELVDRKDAECITWPFARDSRGYASVVTFCGRRTNAHRALCILAHGWPNTDAAMATHICGKGHEGCVNPHHLKWGSAQTNSDDKRRHQTMVQGAKMWKARFSEDEVMRIYSDPRRPKEIAKEIGCGVSVISHIQIGRTWRSVTSHLGPARDAANRKLNEPEVQHIYSDRQTPVAELMEKYGVSESTIRHIRSGRSRRGITSSTTPPRQAQH